MKGRGEDVMVAWLKGRLPEAAETATVRLRLDPKRAAERNKSPDFIVEMTVRVELIPGRWMQVKVPLMVEVEAGAGFSGALEDLERFVTRSNDGSGKQECAIELPFIAATEADAGAVKDVIRQLPVRFKAVEVAIPKAGGRDDT